MGDRPLTVVVAPDSFKGSLSSVEVAEALAHGWRAARPTDVVLLAPLADGGEGTLAAIAAAGGWELASAAAHDPVGRPIDAPWLRSPDGSSAVIELAAASGISRLGPGERDALGASTRGTGEILRCVLDSGARSIMLGIGGSATTDGGWGIVAALGGRLQEIEDAEAEPADGADHPRPVRVDLSALDPRLAEVELRVACDVTNPLLGEHGAAATYGPQKGAAPSDVIVLDGELARFADALEAATGRRERLTPGAGAAGGVGFALLCLQDRFRSFALRPGVELVMEATGFA
ncbi:MAG TPA: glycerate kinase, partial [Candidatus Limnocylindrales bacterium]